MEPEEVFSKLLKLHCSHHPLRCKPSAQHSPFQTLELPSPSTPSIFPLQPCQVPRQLQGHLIRIANHFLHLADKAQSRRENRSPELLWKPQGALRSCQRQHAMSPCRHVPWACDTGRQVSFCFYVKQSLKVECGLFTSFPQAGHQRSCLL